VFCERALFLIRIEFKEKACRNTRNPLKTKDGINGSLKIKLINSVIQRNRLAVCCPFSPEK